MPVTKTRIALALLALGGLGAAGAASFTPQGAALVAKARAAIAPQAAVAAAPPPAETRPVVVEVVRLAPRSPERSFVGTVRPRVESDLGFRVGGKVAERFVTQGARVSAGDQLLRLDPTDLELAVETAEAERRAAQVNLDQTLAQERRTNDLRRSGWTTDANVERQIQATAEARARLDRAGRQLELARNQLSYAVLRADTDGIVTSTLAEPGQVVAAGAPVVRLARAGEREAVVAVPEIFIERVRQGRAEVSLWSQPDRRFPARLRELAAAADPASRTFQARFTIEGADAATAIGLSATVTLHEPAAEPIARLPVSALTGAQGALSVWVVDPATGGVVSRPVRVAGYEGRDVLISEGLAEGDKVVALGVQRLDAQSRVRVVETRG